VFVADYVLIGYGTGAIMAVPSGDQRDWDFATQFGLPIIEVVKDPANPDADRNEAPYTGDGVHVNSGFLDGLGVADAKRTMIERLDQEGWGRSAVTYRLRDWLLSRQRFWGAPIPIVHCPACGEVPVPDEQLPVRLPDLRGADLVPKGVWPQAAAPPGVNVECPACGGAAQRDTDTMDTFVDSSWYYLRYCSPHYEDGPFDVEAVRRWMPVAQYTGGVEHAILHLLYSRFFTKVLHDMGMVDFVEPFSALLTQGQVVNQGKAMSKSLGNGVDLGEQIERFGVDAVRLTMVFAGPPEDDIDWADVSPAGAKKFLARAWRLAGEVTSAPGTDPTSGDRALRRATAHAVHDAEAAIESRRFNVAIAKTMELVNATRKAIDGAVGPADPAVREAVEAVAVVLSLVAPYTAEDMWARLGHEPTVARAGWPRVDPELLVEQSVTCVVQIAGKVRARLQVAPLIAPEELEALALADSTVLASLGDREIRKVIVRAPSLVNLVPA
jgi:leucyl-tRNA synthetase